MSARRRRLTASARVALAVMLVLLAGITALSTLAYLTARSRLAADLDATLLRETEAYAAAVGPGTQADERSLVEVSRAYLEARSESGGVRPILVLRFLDGKVLSNSDVLIETAEGNEALRDPAGASAGYADVRLEGRAYRTVTAPVSDTAGRRVAVFQAAIPADTAERVARQLGLSLLAAGLVVVAAGAVLSAWVARGALAPLREVASTAERVTQQRLAERVALQGPADEIGTVVSSLNAMLDRLEAAFAEQRHFIADASHELRTPLTILRGNLDVMSLPDTTDAERAEAIAAIDRETERMRRIVDDLLALAGLESGEKRAPQEIAAGTLVTETASRVRALGTHEVAAACPDGELWVLGDPDRLEQALLNLVANAQAHTPDGGGISVACHGGVLPDGRPAVLMEVADSGPGIRPEDLPRIFDRFYRAQGPRSGAGGGSGLGLAIAQRLVELHGGVVSAANRPEGGAVFTIALPRIDAPRE